jgi:hypothetical protein
MHGNTPRLRLVAQLSAKEIVCWPTIISPNIALGSSLKLNTPSPLGPALRVGTYPAQMSTLPFS